MVCLRAFWENCATEYFFSPLRTALPTQRPSCVQRRGVRAGDAFVGKSSVFEEGGGLWGCGPGSADADGTALGGWVAVGQVVGTAAAFRWRGLMPLSVAMGLGGAGAGHVRVCRRQLELWWATESPPPRTSCEVAGSPGETLPLSAQHRAGKTETPAKCTSRPGGGGFWYGNGPTAFRSKV